MMVDKRTAAKEIGWFRQKYPELWLEFHDDVLENIKLNPEPY